jgi:hypothetical protein
MRLRKEERPGRKEAEKVFSCFIYLLFDTKLYEILGKVIVSSQYRVQDRKETAWKGQVRRI